MRSVRKTEPRLGWVAIAGGKGTVRDGYDEAPAGGSSYHRGGPGLPLAAPLLDFIVFCRKLLTS